MGASASNSSDLSESIFGNIDSSIISSCNINTTAEIDSVKFNISDSRVGNINVGITQDKYYRSGGCFQDTSLGTAVSNVLSATNSQKATSSSFPFSLSFASSSNSTKIQESITNFINQTIDNSCNVSDKAIVSDVIMTVKDAITGNLSVMVEAPTEGTCKMKATSIIDVSNKETEKSTQTASATNGFGLMFLVLIIVLCLGATVLRSVAKSGLFLHKI